MLKNVHLSTKLTYENNPDSNWFLVFSVNFMLSTVVQNLHDTVHI